MAVLCFVVVGFSFYFKRGFLPADLGKLNKMNMAFGIIQKFCWLLLRIGSYVLLLFVIGLIVVVGNLPDCAAAGRTTLQMYAYIAAFVWIL